MARSLLERFLSTLMHKDIRLAPDIDREPAKTPTLPEKRIIVAAATELEFAFKDLIAALQKLERQEQKVMKVLHKKYEIPRHMMRATNALLALLVSLQPLIGEAPREGELGAAYQSAREAAGGENADLK